MELSESAAWEWLAEMWRPENIVDRGKPYFGLVRTREYCSGLCDAIQYGRRLGMISDATANSMRAKIAQEAQRLDMDNKLPGPIPKTGDGWPDYYACFLWPRNLGGAASRRQFCLDQAALLRGGIPVSA